MKQNQNAIAAININAPYESNFMTILDLLISRLKNWPRLRVIFAVGDHVLVVVAVVERFYGALASTTATVAKTSLLT